MNLRAHSASGLALLLTVTLAGCIPLAPFADDQTTKGEAFVGHVHGLGVDPADGVLYVAAHGGVFQLQDQRLQLVAGRAQDTMGFTVAGPNHFLGSGHPDPTDRSQPVHLGLVESRDAAQTWTPLSLAGAADFHALDQGVDALYGYDSQTSQVLRTRNQQDWEPVLAAEVSDLAAHPTDPGLLLTVTPDGLLRTDRDGRTTKLTEPTGLQQIEWPTPNLLLGISSNGGLYESTDQGRSWTLLSRLPDSQVQAFDATGDTWHLATDQGLYISPDRGTTWHQLL